MRSVIKQNSDICPLNGLRVLDLSRVLAGPLCAMILGDLGANVVKVERPGAGDETRGWGPPFDERGESAYFLSVNRNKLGVAADLGTSAGRGTVLDLVRDADVVIDNYRRGDRTRARLRDRHHAAVDRLELGDRAARGVTADAVRARIRELVLLRAGDVHEVADGDRADHGERSAEHVDARTEAREDQP